MGLGAVVVRGGAVILTGAALYAGIINPLLGKIRQDNAIIEQGYVNPKSLSIASKKNAQGNIEAYLNYKSGDATISLPCMSGPSGPLCGTVDYWWSSIGHDSRTGLVVNEWPSVDNQVKRDIVGSELDAMLESFYGSQKQSPAQQLQQQYKSQANSK